MKYLFLALRPKQWIKNLFILLPLVFGEKLLVFPTNLKVVISFFLFSVAAGVVYLVNDIMDLEEDKLQPEKCLRPIASGKVSIRRAWITACFLGSCSITLSFMLNIYFGWVVVAYLAFNLIYTKILKKMVIIDIFCIGGFFLLRIIAGALVAKVEPSHWIIFMTVLLAMFLGFNKRRQELRMFKGEAASPRFVLTKYSSYFIDQMIAIITSSIVIAYMLYTVDTKTVSSVGTKHLIYSIPFVYYGIFRYLYLIHKRGESGDPTLIVFSDSKMQLNLVLWLLVCVAVIYFGV